MTHPSPDELRPRQPVSSSQQTKPAVARVPSESSLRQRARSLSVASSSAEGSGSGSLLAHGSPQKLRPVPSSGISPRRKPVPSALDLGPSSSTLAEDPVDAADQFADAAGDEPSSPTSNVVRPSPSMPFSVVPLSTYASSSGQSGRRPRPIPRSSSHSLAPATAPASYEPSVPRQRSLGTVDGEGHWSSSFGASAETPSSTSRNTPSSAFPMTPDPPSPSNIDRRGLVGVGELATPRWSQSTGPGSSWSQPHPWQDSGAGSSSWDYRGTSATAERNRSWGELASEALADSQSAAAGVVRIGKSESHLLGQHARGLAAGSDRGLGLDPQEVLALSPSPRMPPALLSSYDLKRDPLAEDAQPTPVSPLTSNDTASSSFFAPAAESAQTYAAGLLAADAAATAPAAIPASSVAGPSSSPRAHRRRPSDQFKLSFGATDAESKAPLRGKSTAGGLDLTPWERHVPPVGTVASPPSADGVAAKPSPTTATSSGAEAGGRKSRERRHSSSKPTTPSSPGHDIVRQFSASHDFSHLPPSPSSSSIQRFIRQSSVSNLSAASAAAAGAVPAVPSLPSLPQASLTVAHSTPPYPVTPPTDEPRRQGTHSGSSPAAYPFPSKRSSLKNLDPETLEALRRLDGLGRSASSVTKGSTRSGRTRASSGAADDATSVKSRPGTPSLVATPERQAGSGWSRSSMPAMPIGPNVLIDDAKADASLSPRSASFAVARSSQGGSSSVSSKRGSASSTTTSPYSTAPSTNTAGTRVSVVGAPKMVRKSSASSDASGAHGDGESIHRDRTTSATGRDELEDIPPVPPLPKAYDLSARSSINQFPSASFGSQAAQLSPATAVVPPTSTVLVATAPSSPSTTVDEPATAVLAPEPDAQTPEKEEVLAPLLRRGSSVDDAATDASSVASPRRSATKKWSFSNAFNKLSSAKHSVAIGIDGSQPRSPTMPIATIPNPPLERASPQIPWAVGGGEPEGEAPADSGHRASTDSYVMPSPPPQTARRLPSTSSLAPPSSGDSSTAQTPSSSHKRLTPSSIPFFRRSSSQSMNKLATASSSLTGPRPPVPSTPNSSAASTPRKLSSASTQEPAPAAALSHRKSMLGNMGFSGMLKSSSSRRSLAAAAADPAGEFGGAAAGKRPREPSTDAGEKDKGSPGASRLTSSLGLLGRRRGKTVSSQDKARDASEQPQPVQAAEAPHQGIPRVASLSRPSPSPATGSGLPQAASSSSLSGSNSIRRQTAVAQPKSNALLRTSRAHLPTISGSPSSSNLSGQAQSFASASAEVGTMSTSSSYSRISDATPTKIPRIASRQSRQLGTPTSAQPSLSRRGSETATLDSFATGLSRAESNLSDFGTLNGEVKAATPAQRFRTTTAASTKADSNEAAATRRYSSITSSTSTNSFITRPPRQLPIPPTSSSAAITAAKRLPSSSSLAEPRRLPSSSSVNSGLAAVAASGGSSLATPRTLASKYAATAQPARMTPSSSTNSLATSSSISRSASASPVVIEDDESIGDEEMRQFMKRQRAKKAAHGATSAEIEAMMNYPDPIAPGTAKTPLAMIKAHFTDLSDYERREITEYTEVYCVGVGSKKKMAKLDDSALNHGYDDDRGDYLVVNGDHLGYRYEVMGILGKGSFGQVVQCRDHKTGEAVAVKIIRNKKRFHHQALVEVKILDNLRKWDPDQRHCVIVMTEHFYFRNHLCIATELLSINLYELIKANSFAGFTTTLIRRFTVQMLQSLILLRQHRVVHCDLKPENILLAHPAKSGIKVIDFGSSCLEHEKVYTYIQSRFYRSPEVILGCNYSQAIDMWSLGCILAELYTGFPIFPGENEQEQLSCIMEVLGLPDKYIVDKSSRKNIFFDTQGTARPVVNSKGKRRRPGTKTLSQVLKTDDELFVDFIAKCLTWDPDRRLKPMPALRHPWLVRQRLHQQSQHQQLPATASTPSSRLSLVSTGAAPTTVTGRIASSLTGTGRAKVITAETPKKAPVIGPPTPLSARVRASNIVVPTHSGSAQVAGGHASHASISSTGSFRQHRASQQALTTSASARHLSVHGALTSSAKI